MADVRLFTPMDLHYLTPQPAQERPYSRMTDDLGALLAEHPARTVWHRGRPVACGGVAPVNAYRALGWAFIGVDAGAAMTVVHRTARMLIDEAPWPRVETTVFTDFEAGHRWARLLGFVLECPRMRYHGPEGEDCALYAKVKDG